MAKIVEGSGGFREAYLQNADGAVRISEHGAHVLAYTPAGQHPLLWVSKEAVFRPGKAIRGGIPICWPWFGDHPTDPEKPAHGFARISEWEFGDVTDDSATLRLTDSDATRALWPHPFELQLAVTLGETLTVALTAHNRGDEPVTCTGALHSYFAVSKISNARVRGLQGCEYIDSIDNDTQKTQRGPISVSQEVDRIYIDTDAATVIRDAGLSREITIAKRGSRSTVVWNPWIEKAARMADFGNDEYERMLCIETANAANDVIEILPGKSHTLAAEISSST